MGKEITYSEMENELNSIFEQMSVKDIPLETARELYKRASKLIEEMNSYLEESEKLVKNDIVEN
ncbi:MAG: exodeoxyribonuclease VII small subunit [Firmicutes bacterium]|uniref:Exodeoxyribonuclease VII small subunit n=1 Tax=Candidatus Scatoplasma merdavium TaxID=2840932 RepID=A0A9D9GS93_9BACL|nr:exodeoxyribonuclease VII small subunit [Candidatus Scatoplasma merdavium]